MIEETPGDTLEDLLREVRARVPLDAAQLLAQQPPERIEEVLRALPQDMALRIASELPDALRPEGPESGELEIPIPGQVSELMEPAIGVLNENVTAAGAVDFLVQCEDVSQITYLYVIDRASRLVGLIVMRDLLLAKPGQQLKEIMLHQPFAFRPEQALSEAVLSAVRRHYPVYPVVNDEGSVVGQVRGWRLFERQAIELTAQSGRMVGVTREERAATPLRSSFFMRHPWLQLNLVTAFMAAAVVGVFEGTIAQVVALAVFLPVLAGQAGNTGCQALAITLRGMTLGDLDEYPVRHLIRKELLLGATNGAVIGLLAGTAMFFYASVTGAIAPLTLAVVVWLAMIGACVASGIFGVLVPVMLKRVGADPATASSIFLTTFTDVFGMGLMLLLATLLVL